MHDAILSFDLEDWFQVVARRFPMPPGRLTQGRLRSQVARVLDLLERHGANATFFILGITAESCPEIVTDVASRGHEIASHGYGHQLVYTLDPDSFRDDIARSLAVLKDCGAVPVGYRAPEFSINASSRWAFDVLLDAGIQYDSSIFPFRGPRYGSANAPLVPHRLRAPSGREILELPLAVLEVFGRRVPIAGGGYWRLFPGKVLNWAVNRVASERSPMLYFHPAEFDARELNVSMCSAPAYRFALKQNLGRLSVFSKLESLLTRHRCISAREYLARSAPQSEDALGTSAVA